MPDRNPGILRSALSYLYYRARISASSDPNKASDVVFEGRHTRVAATADNEAAQFLADLGLTVAFFGVAQIDDEVSEVSFSNE